MNNLWASCIILHGFWNWWPDFHNILSGVCVVCIKYNECEHYTTAVRKLIFSIFFSFIRNDGDYQIVCELVLRVTQYIIKWYLKRIFQKVSVSGMTLNY